jgi:2-polyprenyl-6-methoxyphenol hydroxylase-like FAD-dependent oxidoreductase
VDKDKVLVKKKVTAVEYSVTGVTVKCDDGSSYDGHVLVGADGVNSNTREELWRLAHSTKPKLVSKDRKCKSLSTTPVLVMLIQDSSHGDI